MIDLSKVKEKLVFRKLTAGQQEAVFLCPFCVEKGYGEDTRGHLYLNLSKERYFCHRCNSKGTYNFLASRFGLPPSLGSGAVVSTDLLSGIQEELMEDEVKRLYKEATLVKEGSDEYKYLIGRGLTPEQIQGNKFCTLKSVKDAICWPLISKRKTYVWQCRLLKPTKTKYLFLPKGIGKTKKTFFQWDIASLYSHVYLVEGVFDAIAIGPRAIAALSNYVSNEQFDLLISSNIKKLTICLDRDSENKSIHIAEKMSNYLPEVGYLSWAEIPDIFKDVADIKKELGQQALFQVLKRYVTQC